MIYWDALVTDLESPEATPIGPVGTSIWTVVVAETREWLLRPN